MKPSCADEHAEQAALCRWWAMYARSRRLPESLLFAIPNGGRRDAVTGARLKAEGVRAGAPDMFLAVPRKNAPGLFWSSKNKKAGVCPNIRKPCTRRCRRRAIRYASAGDGMRLVERLKTI